MDAIRFPDEADAHFGKRTGLRDSHDRYAIQEVAHLFDRLHAEANVIALVPAGRVDPTCLPPGPVRLDTKA